MPVSLTVIVAAPLATSIFSSTSLASVFLFWYLKAFESRLQSYNKTAFVNFVPAKHYNRPIPFTFLSQINNAEEFGTNGY